MMMVVIGRTLMLEPWLEEESGSSWIKVFVRVFFLCLCLFTLTTLASEHHGHWSSLFSSHFFFSPTLLLLLTQSSRLDWSHHRSVQTSRPLTSNHARESDVWCQFGWGEASKQEQVREQENMIFFILSSGKFGSFIVQPSKNQDILQEGRVEEKEEQEEEEEVVREKNCPKSERTNERNGRSDENRSFCWLWFDQWTISIYSSSSSSWSSAVVGWWLSGRLSSPPPPPPLNTTL